MKKTPGGKSAARPELENCLKALRPGDTLVVWRLDRLGRSLGDLVAIVAGLQDRGVGFESLTEKIDTNSAAGKLIFHVFAALAEFERNLIRERTMAGLAAARRRGRIGGRKPKVDSKMRKQIETMKGAGISITGIASMVGLSRSTVYNLKPILTKVSDEEYRAIRGEAMLALEKDEEDAYYEILKKLPLTPVEAQALKRSIGVEGMIEEGLNLSRAVEVYGEEWLRN